MILLLLFVALATFYLLKFYAKVRNLPPGPFSLPLIGNLHQLAWGVYKKGGPAAVLRQWKKDYGDVFTWWLGPMASVSICDHQIAMDAMVKKGTVFSSRPYLFLMNAIRGGRGLIFSNGQHWLEQRRFSLHTLRNFGLGKNLMQERIMLEFDYRTSILDKKIEEAGGAYNFDPHQFIDLTVGNIVNRLLFSERFTDDSEAQFFSLKKAMDENLAKFNVFDFMINETTLKIPFFQRRWAVLKQPVINIVDFIDGQIQKRKEEIQAGKRVLNEGGDDFVDAFLIQMKNRSEGDSFDEETLKFTLLDLWLAGQETTTTTLYWGLNYLILHPEVLSKLHDELDTVTGQNRQLTLSDKPNTPYLTALISETLRVSSIGPINAWREASENVVVGSYVIPKGTAISAQLSVLMADEKRFADPETFNPSRFINSEDDQYVVPFGMGKRSCLGEALARAELYLIIGNLALFYDFNTDPKNPLSMESASEKSTVRRAKRYRLNVSKRT